MNYITANKNILFLRKALQELLDTHTRLVNCGDCGNWDADAEHEVIQAKAALGLSEEDAHELLVPSAVITFVSERFISHNDVIIERVSINRNEWDVIKATIELFESNLYKRSLYKQQYEETLSELNHQRDYVKRCEKLLKEMGCEHV